MGPGLAAVEAEIVGIGHAAALAFLRLDDAIVKSVAGGVGHRRLACVEPHADLALHVGRRGVAHDRIDAAGFFLLEFEHPVLGVGLAGLHRRLGGTIDFRSHVPVPLHDDARLKRRFTAPDEWHPSKDTRKMVGAAGFEPATLWSQTTDTTQFIRLSGVRKPQLMPVRSR